VKAAYKLIEHGTDVTAQNNDGWTSLHLALRMGHVNIVARMLIERGADATTWNKSGEALF
jgi:ankyrin repeat protein